MIADQVIAPYCPVVHDECHRTVPGKGAFQSSQLREILVPSVLINHQAAPSAVQ